MESGIDVEGRFRGSKRSFKFDSSSSLRISGEEDNIFPNSVNREDNDDEEALKWAAIQRLPTVTRLRRGLLITPEGEVSEIDVHELGLQERKYLLERLVRIADIDNEKLLLKFRDRVNR
jgi:hypothetical protein